MILNHINLPVADVGAARDFFLHYFGMTLVMELKNDSLAILRDESGMVLNLSHFDKTTPISYHDDFHIGFFLDSREKVQGVYERMIADGLAVEEPKRAHGRWTFYANAPGGFLVEVGALEGAVWKEKEG